MRTGCGPLFRIDVPDLEKLPWIVSTGDDPGDSHILRAVIEDRQRQRNGGAVGGADPLDDNAVIEDFPNSEASLVHLGTAGAACRSRRQLASGESASGRSVGVYRNRIPWLTGLSDASPFKTSHRYLRNCQTTRRFGGPRPADGLNFSPYASTAASSSSVQVMTPGFLANASVTRGYDPLSSGLVARRFFLPLPLSPLCGSTHCPPLRRVRVFDGMPPGFLANASVTRGYDPLSPGLVPRRF